MNYTKGEWKAKERDFDNVIRITSLPDGTFQTINIAEVFGTHGDDLANAHLISAVPDYYKLIEDILNLTQFQDNPPSRTDWMRWRRKAVKVQAKAEGK